MSALFVWIYLVAGEKPVMRLDEVTIEGQIRRPALVEVEHSKLNKRVEEVALSSLVRLEKELLKPANSVHRTQSK